MNDGPGSIERAATADVAAVAALHASEIPEGFLVRLGGVFLRRLYRRAVLSPGAFVDVVREGADVAGFVAVAEDTGRFYREFIVRDGIVAGVAAAPHILRSPRHTLQTLRYGFDGDDDLPPAEILALAVAPAARGRGLGITLVESAREELHRRGVGPVRVVTAAENDAALRTYLRAGFTVVGQTEVHRGVPQKVLVCR